ncbi:hypothetical protein CR513_41191, partial [Mucuna pruriens]
MGYESSWTSTKDPFYKLCGKEKMWVNQMTFDKKNVVEHPSTSQLDQDIQVFSKEEMDSLRALLNSTSKPLGLCALTMKDKSSFNISGSVPQSIWILDSRTTDHIIQKAIHYIVNKDHVPIVGSGNNVLHVPKLTNNLISIHRLIQDWNCAITFFRSHCIVHDLTTVRTIGVAKEHDGLLSQS